MIRTDRFALDADTFAAERRKILERSDARFMDAVRVSLTRLGLPRWEDNIVEMALDIFDETAASEMDGPNEVLSDMRDEFERELRETIAKTKPVEANQFDAQVERLTRWLSTYSVNAGTEAATTSDTNTQVGLEWVTMGDNNVRHTHVEANGETVPSGLPFEVGGFELLYPGQPVGPPEIWINCRCVARPALLEDNALAVKSEAWKQQQNGFGAKSDMTTTDASSGQPRPTTAVTASGPSGDSEPSRPTDGHGLSLTVNFPSGDSTTFAIPEPSPTARAAEGAASTAFASTPTISDQQPPSSRPNDESPHRPEDSMAMDSKPTAPRDTPMTSATPDGASAATALAFASAGNASASQPTHAASPASEDPSAEITGDDPEAPEAIPADEFAPVPWHGVLAPEGKPSGDGRQFDVNGLTHRDLPLPLKAMFVDDEGHKGSVIVGRIDNIFREDGLVKGEGVFDSSDGAYETVRMLAEGMWRGVSVDIDDMQAQLSEDGSVSSATGRICAATICAIPAFAEAFVGLGTWADANPAAADPLEGLKSDLEGMGATVVEREHSVSRETFAPVPIRTMDGPGWITDPKPTRRITDYWVDGRGAAKIGWGAPGDFNRCRLQLVKYVQNPEWLAGLCANLHFRALHTWPGVHTGEMMTLTAAAESEVVPGGYFKDPELTGPTPFTVTEDGRVYGHVATWDTCHIGLPIGDSEGECTTAPHSSTNYAFFLTGEVLTDLGPVAVGQITMGGGHATGRASLRAAISHYDSTSTAVADVTAGEDEHGIWVAGMLRPNVTAEQVHELRAAAISGDWRQVKAGREDMEMIAALAVNVPGFPIPRPSMLVASSGQPLSLVAAAIPLHDGQDAGNSIEISTSPVDKFNAARAKFRALEVARAKAAFATITAGE